MSIVDPMAPYEDVYGARSTAPPDAMPERNGHGGLAPILADVEALLRRFVAFPSEHCLVAVTLWAAHCHLLGAFESTPRLALLSPEKGSGKTRTLEVLEPLVPNPMHAVNCTAAALFRAVAAKSPTLLFDEADTYFGPRSKGDYEELRGLVNAGHRRGAVAYRCVGEPSKMEVREFPAFAAIALAGIGDLPDTILDRSVVIAMRRRSPDERVEPFRERKVRPYANELRDRMAAWAKRNTERLSEAEPALPPGITDRPADVWEPLLAVADAAGADWPSRARHAAVELNRARAERDPSLGVRLLADVRAVFQEEKVFTDDLLERLNGLDEAPWGELRGKPLDSRGLARRLRPYAVRPKQVRIGEATRKGYERADFADAWSRYLALPANTETSETTDTAAGGVTDVSPVSLFPTGEREL